MEQRLTDEQILEKFLKPAEWSTQDEPRTLEDLYRLQYTTLEVLIDVRKFLRKIYKNTAHKQRIVKDPLKANKGDIVIGKDKK